MATDAPPRAPIIATESLTGLRNFRRRVLL